MIKPHWDAHNPWRDSLVYVPVEELAKCSIALNQKVQLPNGPVVIWSLDHILTRWYEFSEYLDAYILTGSRTNMFSAGVRYGMEPAEYLSPAFNLAEIYKLKEKYK